jgi:hypothetical protein
MVRSCPDDWKPGDAPQIASMTHRSNHNQNNDVCRVEDRRCLDPQQTSGVSNSQVRHMGNPD